MTQTPGPGRAFPLLLLVACGILAAQVLLLSWQNRRLREQLEVQALEPPAAPEIRRLSAGDFLPPLLLEGAGGALQRVAFDGSGAHALVFVYSENCPPCQETIPRWNELARRVPEGKAQVMGVRLASSDPASGIVLEEPVFPEYELANLRVPFAKLTSVPVTLLVDPLGNIERVWYGQPGEAEIAELETELAALPATAGLPPER